MEVREGIILARFAAEGRPFREGCTIFAAGPIVSGMRAIARLLRWCGWLLIAACAAAWVVGRVLTDRFAWSQPLWWAPSAALLAPVWVAGLGVVLAWVAWGRAGGSRGRRGGRRDGRGRARRRGGGASGGRVGRGLVAAFAAGSLLHFGLVELGLHRAVFGARGGGAGDAGVPLRLVFWNQAGRTAGEASGAFAGAVAEGGSAVMVLANRHSSVPPEEFAAGVWGEEPAAVVSGWPFDVMGRVEVLRSGTASLGLSASARAEGGEPGRRDPGRAAWYELEVGGARLVVWAVDLPSDPGAHRVPLGREAGRAIASWRGATRVMEGDRVRYVRGEEAGFPAPDVIVGDFNIPRGSASLGVFLRESGAGAMRDAFGEAGWGWERTWPREFPAWAIDHCFVGERVRAAGFGTLDPGVGGHLALVVDLRAGVSPRRGP